MKGSTCMHARDTRGHFGSKGRGAVIVLLRTHPPEGRVNEVSKKSFNTAPIEAIPVTVFNSRPVVWVSVFLHRNPSSRGGEVGLVLSGPIERCRTLPWPLPQISTT